MGGEKGAVSGVDFGDNGRQNFAEIFETILNFLLERDLAVGNGLTGNGFDQTHGVLAFNQMQVLGVTKIGEGDIDFGGEHFLVGEKNKSIGVDVDNGIAGFYELTGENLAGDFLGFGGLEIQTGEFGASVVSDNAEILGIILRIELAETMEGFLFGSFQETASFRFLISDVKVGEIQILISVDLQSGEDGFDLFKLSLIAGGDNDGFHYLFFAA